MKLSISIDVEVSETIADTIKRGQFSVNRDGTGYKVTAGDIVVPSRKCSVSFQTDKEKEKVIEDESSEVCGSCRN